MGNRIIAVMIVFSMLFAGCTSEDDVVDLEFNGTEYREPLGVADFTLTDQNGNDVSLSDFEGKVVVVMFTYTACPDVCLAVENNMAYIQSKLDDNGIEDNVAILSISIDPARDTVEKLSEYTTQMGFDWPHLTSTNHAELQAVWADWNVVVDNDHINSDHSTHGDHSDHDHSDHGDHSEHGDMVHKLGVVFPDNTTTTYDVNYSSDMGSVHALNHSMNAFMQHDVMHSMADGTVTSIAMMDAAYELYMWHEMDSGSQWMQASKNATESLLMQDSNHFAWVAPGANASLLMDPTIESDHSDHEGHGDHSDSGDVIVVEEPYTVGHGTVVFILDEEGRKRVAWTGDLSNRDESSNKLEVDLFLEDLVTLANAGSHSGDHSDHSGDDSSHDHHGH